MTRLFSYGPLDFMDSIDNLNDKSGCPTFIFIKGRENDAV